MDKLGPFELGRVHCVDCLEAMKELPNGGVGAVVTDPPYGLGERMQGGTWGAAHKYSRLRGWDVKPDDAIKAILALGVPTILWGGNYFNVPPSRCWLTWSKQNAVNTMAAVELAWTNLDRPAKEWRGPVGVHSTGHPTEKPVDLMRWVLGFVPDAPITLDPFMGSGTTGVACIHMARQFLGFEIDPEYCRIANERIRAAEKGISLEEERVGQGSLFSS